MTASSNGLRGAGSLVAIGSTQVLQTIQRWQDEPERLARERRQYGIPPPPYPSGETTQPPNPPPALSEADQRMQRRRERLKSIPYNQFDYQWRRELERIQGQITRRWERRKETLPYQMGADLVESARDNVKNR